MATTVLVVFAFSHCSTMASLLIAFLPILTLACPARMASAIWATTNPTFYRTTYFNIACFFLPASNCRSTSLTSSLNTKITGAANMVFTLGLRHTFAFWQRSLALVQFLVVQASFASFRAVS